MSRFYSNQQPEPPRGHYVFVDGPSIDRTLGEVIGRPPDPDTRPDWRRLEAFVKQTYGPAPYTATFVLWRPGQQGFVHFLGTSGFRVDMGERYEEGRKCADLIRQQVERLNEAAVTDQSWQLIVATHDWDLIESLPDLAYRAERITVLGFTEVQPDTPDLDDQIDFRDIEDDARLFRVTLPRGNWEEDDQQTSEDVPEQGFRSTRVDTPAYESPRNAPVSGRPTSASNTSNTRDFYLIVDGRSIEKELGEILGEKPQPGTRPDWGTVLEFARSLSKAPHGEVKALFAHIAPGHPGFRYALKELGYASIPVRPDGVELMRPVVEEYICGLLAARTLRGDDGEPPDIMMIGHGHALFNALANIPDRGQRLVALGFPERMPPSEAYPGIEQLDLERDARAFSADLPRDFGVDVDDFDPDEELSRLF